MMRFLLLALAALSALGQSYSTLISGKPVAAIAAAPDHSAYFVSKDRIYKLSTDGVTVDELAQASGELTAVATTAGGGVLAAGFVTTEGSGRDALVVLLLPTGLPLREFRFGGAGKDWSTRVAVDVDGNFLVLGNTESPDLPVAGGVSPNRFAGSTDGFLLKLTPDLRVIYATYLGGAGRDSFEGLATDASGSVYAAASTTSGELFANSFQPRLNGVAALMSLDAGASFNPPGDNTFRSTVTSWLFTDANTMFAGTLGEGVFRSGDRGRSWQPVNLGLADLRITMLAADPGNGQTIFAGAGPRLYRSVNGGGSWTELPVAVGATDAAAFAVHPRDRNQMFAAFRGPACAFYRSPDGGRTWERQSVRISPSGPSRLNFCAASFLADPAAANIVYVSGEGGVFRPDANSGSDWVRVSGAEGLDVVIADPAAFDTWYAVAAAGALRSADRGATWELATPGARQIAVRQGQFLTDRDIAPPTTQVLRSLAIDPQNANGIYAGFDFVSDLYVAKISPSGNQIVFATYLGGQGEEFSPRIDADRTGTLYVAADTTSSDLAASIDAFQRTPGSTRDLLLARISPAFDLSSLGYFGGAGAESTGELRVSGGLLYLAGATGSAGLPTTPNAFQPLIGGDSDAFLAVFNVASSSSVYLTYWGGSEADSGQSAAIDSDGSALLAGSNGPTGGFAARFTGLITTRPLGAFRNAASLAEGTIAPGSLAVIEGEGFGPLTNLSVRFGDSQAQILLSTESRIDVAVPPDVAPGAVTVRVAGRNGQFEGRVNVERISPGMFSANRDGKGVALGQLVRLDSTGVLSQEPIFECGDACEAIPIDLGDEADQLFLVLRATGMRNRASIGAVNVIMNGRAAEVVEVSEIEGSPGMDQMIVRLPRELGELNKIVDVRIEVTVEGRAANVVTVKVG